jgi:Ser/Thr protein kinase RdoA (MazF antagonist)
MEGRIKERFSNASLAEAMRRYGIASNRIRPLGGFESFIYEFQRDSRAYILRLAHSLRRSRSLIRGEVDWMSYLADGGTPVPRAILSDQGELVEAIDDGHGAYFLATAFEKAHGRPPWEVGWTSDLFVKYGQLLGRIHALSRRYEPPEGDGTRPQWDDPIMQDIERNLPATEAIVVSKYRGIMEHVRALPRDADSYGLIHFDAHEANLLIDNDGTITLFDFDDCAYGWFAYDIAVVLFYIVMGKDDIPGFTRGFMSHFLRGYAQENVLNPKWLREIPAFLKHREIDMYAVIHRSFDVSNLDDPWCRRYMRDRKHMIEHDVPYIDFDFDCFRDLL